MLQITGYTITETLYEGTKTVVYRGYRHHDKQPVIIKNLQSQCIEPRSIAQFYHEYEITKNLTCKGIVKTYDLQKDKNNHYALILEDIQGDSLKNILANRKLDLITILHIAVKLADSLRELHANHIIHKDIKPGNIIVNLETNQVKLTDFSISSRLSVENQTVDNINLLQGTLVYMSPEQTGRMNRTLDYRTDFYSSGVVLYEMLTGVPPFQTADSMELVHCHLAKIPTPPHLLRHEVPKQLSDIVMKLLEKTAEARYQSAIGLKMDLEKCLYQLETRGHIGEFWLGQQDVIDRLQISQKLYGRQAEVNTILQVFEKISQGGKAIVVVSGESGIGKSFLLRELQNLYLQEQSYCINGKFDKLKSGIPYSALIQAFRELLQQILTEKAEQMTHWKHRLNKALGANANVLTEVLPELALVIGEQPPAISLSGIETKNRFNHTFQQFIHLFAHRSHPLVIFLDNLQWADAATLNLLKTLLQDSHVQHLLILAAYRRTDELDWIDPLEKNSSHTTARPSSSRSIAEVETFLQSLTAVERLALAPLSLADINQLVADTLKCDHSRSLPLAELILAKTDGNPFFVNEFLKSLYQDGLLHFTPPSSPNAVQNSSEGWIWDLSEIQSRRITDNVAALMVSYMQRLPVKTQTVLKLASCIGQEFDIITLADVYGHSPKETAQDLWAALETGICVPLGDGYKFITETDKQTSKAHFRFAHEHVQQAAYDLMDEATRGNVHHFLGKRLYTQTATEELEEHLFTIVHHFNLGTGIVTDDAERAQLADLNLWAARKAKSALAYQSAIHFLEHGLNLLGTEGWQREYELMLNLHLESVEVAFLNKEFSRAEALATVVLKHVRSILDMVKIYQFKIQSCISQNEGLKAINTAIEILAKLGVILREKPIDIEVDRLIDLPNMTNPVSLAALRILTDILTVTYITKPELLASISFTMVDLCARYGNAPAAAYGYVIYATVLCTALNDIDGGYRTGKLALALLEHSEEPMLRARVELVFNHLVRPWHEHLRNSLVPLEKTIQVSMDYGEVEHASSAILGYCDDLFFVGETLSIVAQKQTQYLDLLNKFKQLGHIYATHVRQQVVANLQEPSDNPGYLCGRHFDEEHMLPLIERDNRAAFFVYCVYKCLLYVLFEEYENAIHIAETARQDTGGRSSIMPAQLYFYESLALLGLLNRGHLVHPAPYWQRLEQNQKKLRDWSHHAPMNFQHKYLLIIAEQARVKGAPLEAMALYDQAIESAYAQGFTHEIALSNEYAGRFYTHIGRKKVAEVYLLEAYRTYFSWGAYSKIRELEQQYPNLRGQSILASDASDTNYTLSTTVGVGSRNNFDLITVMKASQTISSEIVFTQLVRKMMHIVMENVGAEQNWLILHKPSNALSDDEVGELLVEAHSTVTEIEVDLLGSIPLEAAENKGFKLARAIVNYVARTRYPIVLQDASRHGLFTKDSYVLENQPKSVLCAPIVHQNKLFGVFYLENNLITGAFTPDRLITLKLLSTQIAISLENASFYAQIEQARIAAEKAKQAAESANRAKSAFLANMSHELRTPLNAILGYSDLIYEEAEEALYEDILTDIGKIKAAGNQLLNILSDILDISKIESEKLDVNLTEFAINDLIEEVLTTIQPLVNTTNNTLIVKRSNNLDNLFADYHKIIRILLNLLNNAIKFTNQGTITFTIFRERVTNYNQTMDWINFQIADTGIGIPPDKTRTIFEAFTQVDSSSIRKYGGTGLGLAISDHFCRAMGGNIHLTSELGKGSTFTVRLPVKTSPALFFSI